MKSKLFIRVADKGRGYIADASFKPNSAPLYKQSYGYGGQKREYLPTVHFALAVEIPTEAFTSAGNVVADINLRLNENLKIAASVAELDEPNENGHNDMEGKDNQE